MGQYAEKWRFATKTPVTRDLARWNRSGGQRGKQGYGNKFPDNFWRSNLGLPFMLGSCARPNTLLVLKRGGLRFQSAISCVIPTTSANEDYFWATT